MIKKLWLLFFVWTFPLEAAEGYFLQQNSDWSPLIFIGGFIGGYFTVNSAQQVSQLATDVGLPASNLYYHDVNPYGFISQIVGYSVIMAVIADKVDFLEFLITHPDQVRMTVLRYLLDNLS